MSRLNQRIENFNKSFAILTSSCDLYKKEKENVVYHMAMIQSFEVCFELAWKVLKDFLQEKKGIVALSPKEVIKEAFNIEVIKNGQIWINMLKDRNISAHEYNDDKLNTIFNNISTIYYEELNSFKNWLKYEQ